MQLLEDDIQFNASAPGPVLGSSAQIVGVPGLQMFHYWWVTHFPIGVTVSGPILVRNVPDVLNATNYVIVAGQPSIGALTYDLLRTGGPRLPSGTANIGLAIGLTSPNFSDQGTPPSSYSLAGLSFGAPVSGHINLNNRDYAQPTLVVSPFQLGVTSLIFPDGSSQSTAAANPYSWQQDVQANFHNLIDVGSVEFDIAGASNSMFVALNSSSQLVVVPPNSLSRLIIAQSGQTYIGVDSGNMATAGAKTASLVVSWPSDSTNTGFATLYLFNNAAACQFVIETGSNSQKGVILFLPGSAGTRWAIQTTGSTTTPANCFFVSSGPISAIPVFLINSAGDIGIGLGNTSPTHQLQLSTDDAAKTTTSTWTTTSDIRTKRNVRPLEGGMKVIAELEPIVAEFNGNALTREGSRVVSFDPEKLGEVLPHSVSTVRTKLRPEDLEETSIKKVNIHEVIFHLILAVQQLSQQEQQLSQQIKKLQVKKPV